MVGSVQSSKDRGEWVLVAGLKASRVVQVAFTTRQIVAVPHTPGLDHFDVFVK
ncbi:MAG: hypothetical protein JWQ81_7891 [Amycolatopsis sp.]|nr:hypothetical protein [Amycolatopsis sp.]